MINIEIGMLAKSLAGHDRNNIYMVLNAENENEYVYLVDGKLRTIDNPKKKKVKHIQIIKEIYNIEDMHNEDIKRLIKKYKIEHSI